MLEFETLVRSKRPNNYLLAPGGLCANSRIDAVAEVYPVAAQALLGAVKAVIAQEERAELLEESGLSLEAVQRSKLFKFPDFISVRVLPVDQAHATLAVYSRAKYGRSDLGVNKKRIKRWLTMLEKQACFSVSPN